MLKLKKEIRIPKGILGNGQGYDVYDATETGVNFTYTVSPAQKSIIINLKLVDKNNNIIYHPSHGNISVVDNELSINNKSTIEDDAYNKYLLLLFNNEYSWTSAATFNNETLNEYIDYSIQQEVTTTKK